MYPPLIHLDEQTELDLRSFLYNELFLHNAEKGDFQTDLNNFQKDYWAKSATGDDVTYPFKGGANIIIPLTAIAVEAIHARTIQTLFALEQFVATKSLSDKFADTSDPLGRFLSKELLENVKIRQPLEYIILEQEKFGTGIGKAGYERIVKRAVKYDEDGNETEFEYVQKDGPTLHATPLANFVMRFSETDIQQSLWCGENLQLTPHQVKLYENSEFFYKGIYEKLQQYVTFSQSSSPIIDNEFLKEQQKLEDRVPTLPATFNIVEIQISWNTDRNLAGEQKELVVHYHPLSGLFLAVRYNWYIDLRRPYRTGVYMPVEHRWTGIGICKQNDSFQEEITTIHRQRLDNATLANMRMFKVKKLSGYGPGEPIFPGKMWFLEDMSDIESLQLGEIYPSSFNNEQSALIYSQSRTHVNDATLGMPQVGTPGTATSELSRVQESNKQFDYTYSNTKTLVDRLVLDLTLNIKQFGPRDAHYLDYAPGGDLVRSFFDQPFELIANQSLIEIKSAGQKNNKMLDRQNWQMIGQMYQQWLQGMLQLANTAQMPQLAQLIATTGMLGATESMRQVLESFDVSNISRILPLDSLKAMISGISPSPSPLLTNGSSTLALPGGNNRSALLSTVG